MSSNRVCLYCQKQTTQPDEFTKIGLWRGWVVYSCEEHVKEVRKKLGNLRRSDSALMNARRKKS